MIDYYHITVEGSVVVSNLPKRHLSEAARCTAEVEKCNCPIEMRDKRHGKIHANGLDIYLVSFDTNTTNRIFKQYFVACQFFSPLIAKGKQAVEDSAALNFRRLKHNLVTHNATILQALYAVFPQDTLLVNVKDQPKYISETFRSNTLACSRLIQKILKSANQVKAEFSAFDLITANPMPQKQLESHSAHKIVAVVLSPFWFEFIQNDISIDVGQCHESILVDYESVSVAFYHLFDNATKYIAPKSTLNIIYQQNDSEVTIILEMTSLRIKSSELERIFEEDFSGEFAQETEKAGTGLGMGIAKKLIEFNSGSISVRNNINQKDRREINGIPYERNQFLIRFHRSPQRRT
jgi:signal transduction histidine kinase